MTTACQIRTLLDPYDCLPLECDGFTRIAGFVLNEAGIEHDQMGGIVRAKGKLLRHYWIEVGKWTVDYRLRMWLGDEMPHGVFKVPKGIVYRGDRCLMACNRVLFEILGGKSVGSSVTKGA